MPIEKVLSYQGLSIDDMTDQWWAIVSDSNVDEDIYWAGVKWSLPSPKLVAQDATYCEEAITQAGGEAFAAGAKEVVRTEPEGVLVRINDAVGGDDYWMLLDPVKELKHQPKEEP